MDQYATKNPKESLSVFQENFAQSIASGLSYQKAYTAAGYKGQFPWRHQKQVFTDKVKHRIFEIRQSAAVATKQTIEQLLGELDDARMLAMVDRQPGAVVQAIMGKAKLLGYLIDKSEIELHMLSKPAKEPGTIIDMSVEEWQERFNVTQIAGPKT